MKQQQVLNKSVLRKLIKGASLFTTGGGVAYSEQLETINSLDNPQIPLVSLSNFSKNSYLITAGEVGSTNAPQIKKEKVVKRMLTLLGNITGKDIAGIYPPEIGQESVVAETAHYLNLPIADFDPTGFRAVPYMDINIFNLKNIPYSYVPIVVCNDKEELYLIDGNINYLRTEQILREMTSLSNHNILFFLGGLIKANNLITNNLSTDSYSKAINYGYINKFNDLVKKILPKHVVEGKVTKKNEKKLKGFLYEEVFVKSKDKKEYKLIVLNEALFLYCNQTLIASVPQRILLIDKEKLIGIPSGNLVINKELTLIVIDPDREWQLEKANILFGKNRFQELL